MEDKKQPIVIKRIKRGGGHHGGAWKVAFADFATAMMAFFMLLWLVGGTSKEQKAAISEYFNNPSMTRGVSQTPAPGQMGPGGSSTSLLDFHGTPAPSLSADAGKPQQAPKGQITRVERPRATAPPPPPSPENPVDDVAKRQDQQRLDDLLAKLKQAVDKSQALKPFKDQLLLDLTPEGLRIQIVDKEGRPMFDRGSAQLKYYTYNILAELAKFINGVPNRISIAGHTDATPYSGRDDYSNWELSADRANAARRALVDSGLPATKIARVVGLAASVPLDRGDPYNPVNRRISILVMNRAHDAGAGAVGPPAPRDKAPAARPAPAAPAGPEAYGPPAPARVEPAKPESEGPPPSQGSPAKPPLPVLLPQGSGVIRRQGGSEGESSEQNAQQPVAPRRSFIHLPPIIQGVPEKQQQ